MALAATHPSDAKQTNRRDAELSLPFLGISRSAKGLIWRERLQAEAAPLATAISQRHGLPDILGRVLAARGVTLEDVEVSLNPSLKALMPDPHALQDMERGAARIAEAVVQRQSIAIFGDYDVDGASSSALLSRFFAAHGLDSRIYIPDRIFEGYGPNRAAIKSLIKDGAELIITVDCGTTSHDALEAAMEQGVDVVVIDHHQADEALPPAHAIINPNRQDDVSGQGQLAAAGVVFLVLVALLRCLRTKGCYGSGQDEPDLLEWLDLVALATVCDVVPLTGLNRAYVAKGLQVMRHRRNPGLRALADIAGLNAPPTPYHLGFLLGPRINAGGRIGDAGLGAKLLSSSDELENERIAKLLDQLNKERKDMEVVTLEEAAAQVERALEENDDLPILFAGSEDWHQGLVGLVSSRLTDRFRRPSFVIAWGKDGRGTGSGRSISGVDLGSAVRAAVQEGLVVKGGGHAMAAGLTVERAKLGDLSAFLENRLTEDVRNARADAGLDLDGSITPGSATVEFMDLLEKAGPFGSGNPTPRFAFPAHRIGFAKIVGDAHIRCSITAGDGSRLDAIAFRAVDTELGALLLRSTGEPLHIAGRLNRNHWRGKEKIELMIDDVADPRQQGR